MEQHEEENQVAQQPKVAGVEVQVVGKGVTGSLGKEGRSKDMLKF